MPRLRIEIDVFSGRPNPVLDLDESRSREAIGLLADARRLEKGEPGLPPVPTLGYRGLIVEQLSDASPRLPRTFRVANGAIFGPRAPKAAPSDALERFVLERAGLDRALLAVVRREMARFLEVRRRSPWRPGKKPPIRPILRCRCAPLYEPGWWNDGGQKQLRNNCYNYGSNHRTDTFRQVAGGSQPGAAAGAMYTSLTGPAVRTAAVADGLIDSPGANNKCPGEGHLVALVIAPNVDFHWYRKGRTGRWTHKPGSTPVTDVDNSNALITDPRTADRGMYTQFTTFMVVMHGHVKIK
jgi:hypothetical protein